MAKSERKIMDGESETGTRSPRFQWLRKLYFRVVPRYRRLEYRSFSYAEADRLIRENEGKPERDQWVLAEEEDWNRLAGVVVCLERRERIWK